MVFLHQKILATANVRCSGKKHRISLAENGRLIFHDHEPGLKSERVAVALGSEPCRCLGVQLAWREKGRRTCSFIFPPDAIPDGLLVRYLAGAKVSKERAHACSVADDRLSAWIWNRKAGHRFSSAVLELLEKSRHFAIFSHYAGKEISLNLRMARKNRFSESHAYADKTHGCPYVPKWEETTAHVTMSLHLSWYRTVYRRGLAVVDGTFVMGILAETQDGLDVLAIHQGRGFTIRAWRAHISLSHDGKPQSLRWTK